MAIELSMLSQRLLSPMHIIQKLLAITLIGCLATACELAQNNGNIPESSQSGAVENSEKLLQEAFREQKRDLQVEGKGKVIKLLSDDLDGSKHQRFIVELGSGQTLLIAHNIDWPPELRHFGSAIRSHSTANTSGIPKAVLYTGPIMIRLENMSEDGLSTMANYINS